MTRLAQRFRRLVRDEDGGVVLEYALIGGLILIASASVASHVGFRVMARWTALGKSL